MILYAPRRDWTDKEPKSHGKNDLLGVNKRANDRSTNEKDKLQRKRRKGKKKKKRKKIGLGALEEVEVVSSQR